MSFIAGSVAKKSLSGPDYGILGEFFVAVVVFTLIFELTGAIISALFWIRDFSVLKAIYAGIFHSVSAFCTARFSIFPDSMMKYNYNTDWRKMGTRDQFFK